MLNSEYAKTIKAIENTNQPKKEEGSKKIFFDHPLKTMDATPMNFTNRGFRHLEKQEKEPFKPVSAKIESQEDAHTIKDIQTHKLHLSLQK